MQKSRSGLSRKACRISKIPCPQIRRNTYSNLFKSILFIAGCFSFLPEKAAAQKNKNSLDNQILVELMEHRKEEPTELWQGISNTTGYISLAVPLSVLTVGAIRGDKLTLRKGLYITESIAVSSLVTYGLKYTIKRQRPNLNNSFIVPAGKDGSPSFPSGHTSQAFATATSLTMAYPKWYVAIPAFTWASSVGFSRMYLGVHYPSDVLGGALVGAGSAWLTYKANKWLHREKTWTLRPTF